jgi:hypothetical protein
MSSRLEPGDKWRPELGLKVSRSPFRPARITTALALTAAALAVGMSTSAARGQSAPSDPAPLTPPYPDANDPVALGRWFGQTTHLPAASILAITDNAIFAAFPKHTSGPYWTVDVRVESITPQSTEKLGGRSIHLRLNVRCDNTTVRLNFLDAYPGADLTGAPAHRAPPNDWAQPKPNSYVADAVRLACDKTFQGPFAAIAAAAPKTPPIAAVKPKPTLPATERTPALRTREPLAGGYAAQIGAFSTAAMSQDAWRALKAAQPDQTRGLSNATTAVAVHGRTVYRALVEGFPSSEAAAAFCRTLKASGRPCLVALGGR